jgi:uncharacterized membrane protein YgdD (TMEM256/DUF423 family)
MTLERIFFAIGCSSAFIAVAAGAFGAHGLRNRIAPDLLAVFEVAVRYQMYHALALFACAWAVGKWPGALTSASGWLFVAGTLVFSGSLYALSLSGVRWLGAVAPIGGLALLGGWLCLLVAALRQ